MLIVFVVTSRAWAQAAYGVPSQNYCQATDFSGNSYAPQYDTSAGGNGKYATVFNDFTLAQDYHVLRFHWVGEYSTREFWEGSRRGPRNSISIRMAR